MTTLKEAKQKIQFLLEDAEAHLDAIQDDLETLKSDWEAELDGEEPDEEAIQDNLELAEEAIASLTKALDALS